MYGLPEVWVALEVNVQKEEKTLRAELHEDGWQYTPDSDAPGVLPKYIGPGSEAWGNKIPGKASIVPPPVTWRTCFWGHRWGLWARRTERYEYAVVTCQTRQCRACGKTQDAEV